jgi:hypothetical protein
MKRGALLGSSYRVTGIVALTALALAACDQGAPPDVQVTEPTAAVAPAPAERPKSQYLPMGAEAQAQGLLTIELPPGGVGSGRTFTFGNGLVLEAELVGTADITKPIGDMPMAAALGVSEQALKNNGDPKTYLLQVKSETPSVGAAKACGESSPTHAVIRQLETEEDKTLTIVLVSAIPGETGAKVCRKVVYTAQ